MLKKGKANIGKNITELKADNKKSGKAKGAGGTPRPMKQILAIALNTAGVKPKKITTMKMDMKMETAKKHEKMETPKFKKIEKKAENKMGKKS
tara:strand:- start:6740 stop:7018 length:279 start_codon:yes stop_codon:yes gene_type:complete